MEKLIKNAFKYIRGNMFIAYSLALVFVIPLIFFGATYYNISLFEKNFNHLLQTKAQLLENVFVAMIDEAELESNVLQQKIEQIIRENGDVAQIKILEFDGAEKSFKVIASSKTSEIGEFPNDPKDGLVMNMEEEIASIVIEGGERFWEVSKSIRAETGRLLIIKTKLSLARVDQIFNENVTRAYWILVICSMVLVLLVTNYARLSRYVLLFNKMKEVDEMKDNFIAMASHELKTPLTAITGYAELLETGAKEKLSAEERGYLKNIGISSQRLRVLVNDILEVSRLEQNRIPFKIQRVDSLETVAKVVETLKPQAASKNLKIHSQIEIGKAEASIEVDQDRFEQILVNLAGNSVKYTDEGEVKIRVYGKKDEICFSVEDTGIGMNPAQVKKLFSKFYRAKNNKTAKTEGTGLGLWITKELVDKMEGKISVESMEGVGSKFIVTFKKLDSEQ